MRTPEQCPFREPVTLPGRQQPAFVCELARRVVAAADKTVCLVQPDACAVCCDSWQPGPGALSGVVASLVFDAANRLLADPNASTDRQAEAQRALRHVLSQLELVANAPPGSLADTPNVSESGIPVAGVARWLAPESGRVGGRASWATAVITAPRPQPTIGRTLHSLRKAGFPSPHIFAEPGSVVPEPFHDLPATFHGRCLGHLGNLMTAFWSIYMMDPQADRYVVFEDDVEVAEGLCSWCDQQFWPHGVGLVSLYTSRVYASDTAGWHVWQLGSSRTFGSPAFVFRRDVLAQFLRDGRALEVAEMRARGGDAVVGEWATRRAIGIAYHTPSLVQHIGVTAAIGGPGHGIGRASQADAVRTVAGVKTWRPPKCELGKVGLVGWNTATGLGYQNLDIATHLAIEKWLVPTRKSFRTLPLPRRSCRVDRVSTQPGDQKLKAWLTGLDWVLFVEHPYIARLPQLARELDLSVACVPNWEYTDLELDWLHYVDLMICPTRLTYDLMSDWKARFGFMWDLVHVAWPIDTRKFRFRKRDRCRSFVFVNGTGSLPARRLDGSTTNYRRKGLDVVLEAARTLPRVPLVVYTQTHAVPMVPGNVSVRKAPRRNQDLYREGDVCVQPSYWEGLGLPLLECQAAGMPLVTTDAPPMNEYRPLRVVPVGRREIVSVAGQHPITSARAEPAALAAILEEVYDSDIAAASEKARQFVQREHGWDQARQILAAKLRK